MKIDIDTYKEIIETITRNKTRSVLTGFGVFWGIFMLVVLLGGGNGVKDSLNNNFAGFATNSAILYPNATTKPYHGYRKGRTWGLTLRDVTALSDQLPEFSVVTPLLMHWGCTAYFSNQKSSCNFRGVTPDYAKVEEPQMRYGRYINAMDLAQHRKVCVLGKRVYSNLFPNGGDPTGKLIRVDSTYYYIVGVNTSSGSMSIGSNGEDVLAVPLTLMQQTYNSGDSVTMICLVARPGVRTKTLVPRIREVVGHTHDVAPDDEKALTIVNTEVMFSMLDSLFSGVNFLVWLVGIGTLLAGAIGVSNIMMVTVRERTTEIGIRRAIGATPRMILTQIIAESILLTLVAGMSGIIFGVLILQMLQVSPAGTENGMTIAHYQITFWLALGALVLLTILGVLAGLAPALRAMSIKPVDAMRDE